MAELRALHLLSKWGSGGSAAVLLFTPWRERRGDQLSSSLTPGLLLLLRAPAASCERCPDGAADGPWRLGSSSGAGGGGDGDGLISWSVSLPPVDPWWRGAGASRSNWAKVAGRRALRLTHPRSPIMGGLPGDPTQDALAVCCYSVTSFSPGEIASSRAACHWALRAGRAEFRAGSGGGDGGGRRMSGRR